MSDPLNISPYLENALRGIEEVCHDEGRRARRLGADIDECAYTLPDMLDAWREGWAEQNAEIEIKEMIDDR